jgi:hypothetical protein
MSFSGTHNYVFKTYKYALGIGEIHNTDYKAHIKTYLTDVNFWSQNKTLLDNVNVRFKDFKNMSLKGQSLKGRTVGYTSLIPTNLKITEPTVTSYNSETGMTSNVYYEQIKHVPASAKIFSTENNKSWVTHDLDWSLTANKDPDLVDYWQTEYDFNTKFNINEYRAFNLGLNNLDENVICLSGEKFKLDNVCGNISAMDRGAAGMLLTYTDDNHKDNQEIPMVFIEFPKFMNSNNNHLEVDWNQDGIVKVE